MTLLLELEIMDLKITDEMHCATIVFEGISNMVLSEVVEGVLVDQLLIVSSHSLQFERK